MTKLEDLTITDRDNDTVRVEEDFDPEGFLFIMSSRDGAYLTKDDARSLRDHLTAALNDGAPAKPEPDYSYFELTAPIPFLRPEPTRYLFGVPEEVVQSLVQAAIKSATVELEARERVS